MYLGPSASSKGFRFYDPKTKKVFESRDVIWYDDTPFYAKQPDPQPTRTIASEQDPFEVLKDEEESEDAYQLPQPALQSAENPGVAAPAVEPSPSEPRKL